MILSTPLRAAGRAGLAVVFVYAGAKNVQAPTPHAPKVARLGIPEPELAVRIDGFVKVGAGLAMTLGVKPRLSALILVAGLVPTTLAGHRFWEEETPQGQERQKLQFAKNAGLLGGLLMVVATSPQRRPQTEGASEA